MIGFYTSIFAFLELLTLLSVYAYVTMVTIADDLFMKSISPYN